MVWAREEVKNRFQSTGWSSHISLAFGTAKWHTTVQNANKFCFHTRDSWTKPWQHVEVQNRLSSTLCTALAVARLQLKCILVVAATPLLLLIHTLTRVLPKSVTPKSCLVHCTNNKYLSRHNGSVHLSWPYSWSSFPVTPSTVLVGQELILFMWRLPGHNVISDSLALCCYSWWL